MPQAAARRPRPAQEVLVEEVSHKALEWKLKGAWLPVTGCKVSLFGDDQLESRLTEEDCPELFALLDALWPDERIDHIVVVQKSAQCAHFRVQLVEEISDKIYIIKARVAGAIHQHGVFA